MGATADQDNTIWERGPHTAGKHLVLERYLQAWFSILGKTQQRILFVDGFAGPGEYVDGKMGSPLIALRVLREHSHRSLIKAETVYLFIEKDAVRCEHLRRRVDEERPSLPNNCHVEVICGKFDETMTAILDYLDEQAVRLAPAFVMVDPFGVSGAPMSIIDRILQNPKAEVYISFMYEAINRFLATDEFGPPLDSLFGCPDWRHAIEIEDREERKRALYDLYEKQLRRAGAEYVLHFEIYDGNRLVYAIFFATHHYKGCDKMKEAIWKVAPDGDYAFRATDDRQMRLDISLADFGPFKRQLIRQFGKAGWITIGDVEAFVQTDATPYRSGQLKRRTLKPMEEEGMVEVDETTRQKRGTYPDGTRLRFKDVDS
jgi:three-Cys-motif partner protein